jgi:hypothetical protein
LTEGSTRYWIGEERPEPRRVMVMLRTSVRLGAAGIAQRPPFFNLRFSATPKAVASAVASLRHVEEGTVALLDHQGGADFPYSRADVFDALVKVIPEKGMKIAQQDRSAGIISAKAGMSLASWGENIPISVTEGAAGYTRVAITSTPKTGLLGGGAFDLGKNRRNIEKILLAASESLQKSAVPLSSKPSTEASDSDPAARIAKPSTEASDSDPAARIAKLKSLLDEGLIESDDFERRKQEILSDI